MTTSQTNSNSSGLLVTDSVKVDGSSSFMTETLLDGGNSSLINNFPSAPPSSGTVGLGGSFSITQSSIFSTAEEAFTNINTVQRSNLLIPTKRPVSSINGLQKSERIMCSKILKNKIPSLRNAVRRRKFLESSRLIHHVKEKKKNVHPVTSYGGPVRKWPTKRRGKIAPLVHVRHDNNYNIFANQYLDQTQDIYTNDSYQNGQYFINNVIDGQNIYEDVNTGQRFIASSESNFSFLAGKPGSKVSDFKNISRAGGNELLLRPWSQRKGKDNQSINHKYSKQGGNSKEKKLRVYKKIPPYGNPNQFRALSPVLFPIFGDGKAANAKLAHSLSSSIRPKSVLSSRTMSGNSITLDTWDNYDDIDRGEGSVNSSVILPVAKETTTNQKRGSCDEKDFVNRRITSKDDNLLVILMPKILPTANAGSPTPSISNDTQ
jgi:hypothetical protein